MTGQTERPSSPEPLFADLCSRPGAFDLHALLVAPDLVVGAGRPGTALQELIPDPAVPLAVIVRFARTAGRFANAYLDGGQPLWVISGGSQDDIERAELQHDFEVQAAMGALWAGLVEPPTAPQQAVQAWLHAVADSQHKIPGARIVGEWGCIENLPNASVRLCKRLERDAALGERQTARVLPAVLARPAETHGEVAIEDDTLGARLKSLRSECCLSHQAFADRAGLEKTSVIDHEKNRSKPTRATMAKYAKAFSEALGRPITIQGLGGR